MATFSDPALREVSILIHAFELVFRKLIRLLIGKISIKKIQEMIHIIFVEEAEAKLKQQRPGQNVSLADLALLADVDSRVIKKARKLIGQYEGKLPSNEQITAGISMFYFEEEKAA